MVAVDSWSSVFVLRCSAILSLDLKLTHQCETQKKESYFWQARDIFGKHDIFGMFLAEIFYLWMQKTNKIQALPRWIAGNHTFYFGKTCLFQDGRGDDKKVTENV